MAEGVPRGDAAVYVFLEMAALVCLFEWGDSYRAAQFRSGTIWFSVGFVLFFLGIKWAKVKGVPLLLFDGARKSPAKQESANGLSTTEKMPIWKAVHHVAVCLYERREDGDAFPKARDALRQAAIDGKITIWGKKELELAAITVSPVFDACMTAIPRDYWNLHRLTGVASEAPINPIYPFTISVDGVFPKLAYADLHVDEPQIIEVWRPAAPVGSANWQQMAKDFESCPKQIRAEYQRSGIPGEDSWYVGAWSPAEKCRSLCGLAGAMLLRSPNVCAGLSKELRSVVNDPMYRWLYFLKDRRALDNYIAGVEDFPDGRKAGVYAGLINNLPEVSAAVCIECAAKET